MFYELSTTYTNLFTDFYTLLLDTGLWTIVTHTSTTLLFWAKSDSSLSNAESMAFRITRSAATAKFLTIEYSSTGHASPTWNTIGTFNLLPDSSSVSGSDALTLRIDITAVKVWFSTTSNSVTNEYYSTMAYLGLIDRFVSTDYRAWGAYISGAPELSGKYLLQLRTQGDVYNGVPPEGTPAGSSINIGGVSYGVLETFMMRSMSQTDTSIQGQQPVASDAARKTVLENNLAPFTFVDVEGYDGAEIGYQAATHGITSRDTDKTNVSGSASFTGPTLRDLFEEEKYIGSRLKRIGIFREFNGYDGYGMRGTLQGLYSVKQAWGTDSAGAIVPKQKWMAPANVKVYTSSRGSTNFSGEDDWVVLPLANNVKNNYLYNGLDVVAVPKILATPDITSLTYSVQFTGPNGDPEAMEINEDSANGTITVTGTGFYGATYLWTVVSGTHFALTNTTTATVTFNPTAGISADEEVVLNIAVTNNGVTVSEDLAIRILNNVP